MIRFQAKKLCEKIIVETPDLTHQIDNFKVSKGWLERFKARREIKNMKLHGEAQSADVQAAAEYKSTFLRIIEKGKYTPEQVYNMDETALIWKKMPKRTFISKKVKMKKGPKVAKDRITLVFCSNAAGTHFITPLVLYKSLKPRAFKKKNVSPEDIGISWGANSKAWMTQRRCRIWFDETFVPEVEEYLKSKNIYFKALLILDNASGHPLDLKHSNVTVTFLPPNTTSVLQPQDQGIISVFKNAYMRLSLEHLLSFVDRFEENVHDEEDKKNLVVNAWKSYDIVDCLLNIIKSN